MIASTRSSKFQIAARSTLILLALVSIFLLRSHQMLLSLLSASANPNVAIPLLVAGILLIYAEFNVPGAALPGSLGTLMAMLAIYGVSRHHVDRLALAALTAGIALTIFELYRPMRYLMASPGTAAVAFGFVHLGSNPAIAVFAALVLSVATLVLGRIALIARSNKISPQTPQSAPARVQRQSSVGH